MTQPKVVIKARPEDWQVEEEGPTCVEPGSHQRFYIEKTCLNTLDVVDALAAALQIEKFEVGYAGRKDKWGVTRQWFSVPRHCDWPEIPGTRCLDETTSRKKLRIGELTSNRFVLTLRDVSGVTLSDLMALESGFANKFGSQRTSEDNVEQAETWLMSRRRRKTSKRQQGWYLSVLRASLFNDVVDLRASSDLLNTAIEGDVLVDGLPSAPLWGRGRSKSKARAAQIEQEALAPRAEICEALEFSGVAQARRPIFVRPAGLSVNADAEANLFQLEFSLPPGSYATTMLAAVAEVIEGEHETV